MSVHIVQLVEEDDIQVYDWEFWEVEDRNSTYLSDTIIFHQVSGLLSIHISRHCNSIKNVFIQAAETSIDEELLDMNDELHESPIDGSVCVFDEIAIDTYSIADSYSCREDDDDFPPMGHLPLRKHVLGFRTTTTTTTTI